MSAVCVLVECDGDGIKVSVNRVSVSGVVCDDTGYLGVAHVSESWCTYELCMTHVRTSSGRRTRPFWPKSELHIIELYVYVCARMLVKNLGKYV